MVIFARKVLPYGVFQFLAPDGCKLTNHSVRKATFGLAYIMHATPGAFDGIDQIV